MSFSHAAAAALLALFLRPLAPHVVVKIKTPQPVALLLGMSSRRRPAAYTDGLAAQAPAHPISSTVLRPAKMLHRRKSVGRLPLTITRSLSSLRTTTTLTTPRPPAYTKHTSTARHHHARAASPPSVRHSTAHPRANVLVRATILRVPPPTFAPRTSPASRTPAPSSRRFTRAILASQVSTSVCHPTLHAQRLFCSKYEQDKVGAHFTFLRAAVC